MAGESITFDFVGRNADTLQRDFKGVGDNAAIASKGARLLADALEKQRKAADVSAGATLALAKADDILKEAEHGLADGALEAEFALKKQGEAAKKAGKDAAEAKAGVTALAGTGGVPGGGMGAAIAAGAVLSPILVTLGIGLAGFGLAAAGVAKPIENAAQKTGGLRANLKLLDPEQRAVAQSILGLGKQYDQFQKTLQPQVLNVFNQGIGLAGHLLHDVQPVAQATGKALGVMLGQVDKEFQSGTWKQFFQFMATTAGPDMQLLTNNFTGLLNVLPGLLIDLQPLATGFLQASDNAIKLAGAVANLGKSTNATSQSVGTNVGLLGFLSRAVANVSSFMKPGGVYAGALATALGGIPGAAGAAGNSMGGAAVHAMTLATSLAAARTETANLTTAENNAISPLLAYTNALITQSGDAVKLATALKSSGDQIGFGTAAQRASFSAANTYIQDLLTTAAAAEKSHQGIDAQITSISNALPMLQNVKGGTAQYRQEVQDLVGWLQKLQQIKLITESIHVSGTGVWTVTPGNIGLPGGSAGGPFAAGGMVTGGIPGRDSVLIRAMPGEVVVPTGLVGAGAVDHLRGKLPGFAAGGVVGSYAKLPGMGSWLGGELRATESAIGKSVASALVAGIKSASAAASSGGGAGTPGPGGGAPSANAALARKLMPSWGSGAEWNAWNYVAMRESGWNQFARNPSSGAYGIPQALPASKMGAAANPPQSNPAAQIRWMIGYIQGRYRDPIGAAAHERSFNWYDKGGLLPTGPSLSMNGTGQPEHVIPGAGIAGILSELSGILAAIEALTSVASGGSSILGGVGNSTSIVSPSGGGFGLTRSDLGLPPPASASSSTADTSGSGAGSGAAAPATPKAKPKPDPAKNAAIKVLTSLLAGDITHNRLAAAQQANSLLDWLGVSSHDKTVRQVASLDRLLAQYRKAKNSRAVAATEQLLRSFGVHDFTPQLTVKGNPAKTGVIARIERLIKADIAANNLGGARQANALLTPLGVHKYSGTLGQIAMLDGLLAKYKKAKDVKDVKATEEILRTYGVRKFDSGGILPPGVTLAVNNTGRPELVVPARSGGHAGGGGDIGGRLDRLIALHEQLIKVAASAPAATGRHVAAGVNGAAADAVFRGRYPGR